MSINTSYTDYYGYGDSYSNTSSSSNNMLEDWMYTGSTSASEASYRTKTKELLANKLSQSSQNFILDAKSSAEDLKSALNNLLGKNKTGTSSFDKKTAVSSDEDSLVIKSVDSKKAASDANITVQINQIATTQKNGNTALISEAITEIDSGAQQMSLTVGGKAYTIDYNVSATDTNKQAQQKMAAAINKQNAGVKATVATDSEGNSTLSLESTDTGVNTDGEIKFSISDVTGNAVSKTGINTITQNAQNAKYSVNGGAITTSKSNDVDLGNGIAATLKGSTANNGVTVKMGKDISGAIEDVKKLVNSFNSLMEAASDNRNDRHSNKLYNQLSSLSKTYGESLHRIGISVSGNGTLKIDEDKLKKSTVPAEYSKISNLEKFFTSNKGTNYGFANRLTTFSENVSSKVTDYISTNSGKTSRLNSSQISMYNSHFNTSLMLDMFS